MKDHELDLSRRRILGAMGTIGGAAALGGASTMAFFSDSEEFANNSLTAGELDLKLAWEEQYFGEQAEDQFQNESGGGATANLLSLSDARLERYPDPTQGAGTSFEQLAVSDPCTQQSLYADTPDDLDPTQSGSFRTENDDTYEGGVKPLISIQDAKPGDFGFTRFKLILCDNPGYIWSTGGIQSIEENGQTEPERKDPQSSGAQALTIADEIRIRVFQDLTPGGTAVSNFFSGLTGVTTGPELIDAVLDFFQLRTAPTLQEFSDALSSGAGIPLDGEPLSGAQPSGTTIQNNTIFLYDLPGGQATERECFDTAAGAANLGIVWALPVNHANEIQGDSVSLDIGYYTEQCRHNDGSGIGNT
ncbi:SipW-dependent-type signal peptide-containing protein [Salinigranum salinum]|uniref:SipW-dependent-type signal peptide-containing protein n=1 Tax=Salinigranum salinum TaxID=1364937 RepID=UPI001F050043|nr:SipW-dependent-type signal peptide-containing protein [Salinigranum salinum]